jgi:hypothetical protein
VRPRIRLGLLAVFQSAENFLDFVVDWKSPSLRFRENQAAIRQHVELARLTGFDLDVFGKLFFE